MSEKHEKTIRCKRCHTPLGEVIHRNGIRRLLLYVRVVVARDSSWTSYDQETEADKVLLAEITGKAKVYCFRCGEMRPWYPDAHGKDGDGDEGGGRAHWGHWINPENLA